MNKRLLSMLLMFPMYSLYAPMVYDPVSNTIYSTPQTPDINLAEYYSLLEGCLIVDFRTTAVTGNLKANKKQILRYLKSIGTPTAKRLIKDLKMGAIYFPDGSVCRKWQ